MRRHTLLLLLLLRFELISDHRLFSVYLRLLTFRRDSANARPTPAELAAWLAAGAN